MLLRRSDQIKIFLALEIYEAAWVLGIYVVISCSGSLADVLFWPVYGHKVAKQKKYKK